ncbi:MAG: hypothetical protein DRQ88_06880 [Epsilonproteobacteria bacterium]|nr:MAG: hypothetical protein DRQ89_05710 [Campylobacterota bacterium]RLA66359.1 MAG: hypothetical protein DRQ88_06880 [Campylobacterota bacterium]
METELIEQRKVRPAGFWVRLVATIIDGVILSIVHWPINRMFPTPYHLNTAQFDTTTYFNVVINGLFSLLAIFLYYGWFYKNKGGTPGKLALDLTVINTETGQNLSYLRSFFRETIGKFCSAMIFGIGFIMAALRSDKKALHDLIMTTQVLKKDD